MEQARLLRWDADLLVRFHRGVKARANKNVHASIGDTGTGLLRWRVMLTLWCMWLAAPAPTRLQAQTNAESPTPSNRCLLIVETSRAMQRRARGVFAAAKGLLEAGLKNQLDRGDALSLWTFNESLYTNRFEPWSAQAQLTLAVRLPAFLDAAMYEKRANLDKVLPEMSRTIRESAFITIILVTAGEGEMRGTPFDDMINQTCKQWRQEQQKARMPFVILLRASRGQITDWSVNPAPWPVEIPALPPEPQSTRDNSPKPPEAARMPEPSANPLPIVPAAKPGLVAQPKPPASSTPKTEPGVFAAAATSVPREESNAALQVGARATETNTPVLRAALPSNSTESSPPAAQKTVNPPQAPAEPDKHLDAPAPARIAGEKGLPSPTLSSRGGEGEESASGQSRGTMRELGSRRSFPEKKPDTLQAAPAAIPQSFLRENAVWLAISVVSGIAGLYFIVTWRRIYMRPKAEHEALLKPPTIRELPPAGATQVPGEASATDEAERR